MDLRNFASYPNTWSYFSDDIHLAPLSPKKKVQDDSGLYYNKIPGEQPGLATRSVRAAWPGPTLFSSLLWLFTDSNILWLTQTPSVFERRTSKPCPSFTGMDLTCGPASETMPGSPAPQSRHDRFSRGGRCPVLGCLRVLGERRAPTGRRCGSSSR